MCVAFGVKYDPKHISNKDTCQPILIKFLGKLLICFATKSYYIKGVQDAGGLMKVNVLFYPKIKKKISLCIWKSWCDL